MISLAKAVELIPVEAKSLDAVQIERVEIDRMRKTVSVLVSLGQETEKGFSLVTSKRLSWEMTDSFFTTLEKSMKDRIVEKVAS